MDWWELLVALLAGVVQGIFEWLPISSQGNLSILFTALGESAETALALSLFLHLGTTIAATVYYRADIRDATEGISSWRPGTAFAESNAEPSFVVLATITTGLVGVPLYFLAIDVVSEVGGGVFVAGVGALLVLTGVVQLTGESVDLGERRQPTMVDAVLVGAAQALAILPGVSRSGTTTSVLLFEGYEAPAAFRLSFLLSIPAGIGATVLVVLDVGGLPDIGLAAAILALGASVIVGYLAIDALLAIVERVPFWAVCFGLGALALLGGAIVVGLGG